MKTSDVVLVGYTTRAREDAQQYIPAFEANKGVKDAETKERQIEAKRASFLVDINNKPYLGELDQVYMAVASELDTTKHVIYDRDEVGHLLGPSIANSLQTWFGERFNKDTGEYTGDPIRFVGFGIREFMKMLALECAEYGDSILPHAVWYNTDYRDVRSMVLPSPECDHLTMDVVLERFNIPTPDGFVFEPGDSAQLDAMVAAECIRKLNIFPSSNLPLARLARSIRHDLGVSELVADLDSKTKAYLATLVKPAKATIKKSVKKPTSKTKIKKTKKTKAHA